LIFLKKLLLLPFFYFINNKYIIPKIILFILFFYFLMVSLSPLKVTLPLNVELPPALEVLDLFSIIWDEKSKRVTWGNFSDLFCSVLFTHLYTDEVVSY
jgi:hypothetical protein